MEKEVTLNEIKYLIASLIYNMTFASGSIHGSNHFLPHFSRWFDPDAEVGGVTPLSKHHFMRAVYLSARILHLLVRQVNRSHCFLRKVVSYHREVS